MIKKISIALMFAALAAAGCSDKDTASSQAQDSASPKQNDASAKQKQPATPVGYVDLTLQQIPTLTKIPGRVVPYQVAQVRPQISGIIQSRLFTEGALVKEGDQLYQIEPNRYQAEVDSAQADLNNAQARVNNAQSVVERYDSLAESDVLSQQVFEDAQTELMQAKATLMQSEAQLKRAKINLAYTKVYAPITGYIGPSSVTKGALVSQQQEQILVTIRQLDPVYVDFSVSASDRQLIGSQNDTSQSQSVSLFLNSGERSPQIGKIIATDFAVDNQTGTIQVRTEFANPETALLPGLFVRGAINDSTADPVIIVPQKSVKIGANGKKHVWVIDADNKARQREVTTGTAFENKWVIENGLKQGERLIVEGTMTLADGQRVKPQKVTQEGDREANQKTNQRAKQEAKQQAKQEVKQKTNKSADDQNAQPTAKAQ